MTITPADSQAGMLLPFAIGVVLALGLAALARLTAFDRDRSFYPTVLIVIASYYLLFAVMGGQAWLFETLVILGFSGLAFLGYYRSLVVVGAGILAHGLFDFSHPWLWDNPGVPGWWPAFCAGVDIPLGLWVMWSAKRMS